MKKFILIISLVVFITTSKGQILSFTYSPQNNDLGACFISKPVIQNFSIYSSFELANYKLINSRLDRLAVGLSYNYDAGVFIHLAATSVFFDTENIRYDLFNPKPLSIEIGVTLMFKPIKNTYLSLIGDPFNYHFKFGFGYKF
jgi:hypothetical protein